METSRQTISREELETVAQQCINAMFDVSEAELENPLDHENAGHLSLRHKILAALALAARDSIRAFLIAEDQLK
ncbi:MAG: hypothetical protein LUG19_07980 [Desulfovibrio sp.]|uniref:hypothetical protein n=1 Tax=Desulfovibrio sp. TaxID=885 RepID=UPI00258D0329|nr:hypothetical protein [Desulfovibrio sp.]MCD7984174.1 hypothetical protein [Desulfovibrio sp.]